MILLPFIRWEKHVFVRDSLLCVLEVFFCCYRRRRGGHPSIPVHAREGKRINSSGGNVLNAGQGGGIIVPTSHNHGNVLILFLRILESGSFCSSYVPLLRRFRLPFISIFLLAAVTKSRILEYATKNVYTR